jgi:hypothetical protein
LKSGDIGLILFIFHPPKKKSPLYELFALALSYLRDVKYRPKKEAGGDYSLQQQ